MLLLALTVQKAKNTQPAAYLVKPFNTASLLVSVELAIHNFATLRNTDKKNEIAEDTDDGFYLKEGYLFIKDGQTFFKVYMHDILYLSSDDNYIRVATKQKNILVRSTLTRALEKLQQPYFVRIHRSHAININNINSFTENEVVVGNQKLPIGRNYKEEIGKIFKFG
ncbi:hypothetical protein CAP35_02270 [Chitinophagaceae bacterium IBVUCB1]|nr:hypothetical protein CAP35_02270 [Chitinophagaceae bacterium IBVUCB1]